MKNKLSALILLMLTASLGFSQKIANNDLIGKWYGPNSTTLYLESDGTGNMDLGQLKCQLKIVSWSATATVLSIHWDMTPIDCQQLDNNNTFKHKPKIEFDNPVYTISKKQSTIAGMVSYTFTLNLNNKEYNSAGTYTKVEVVEPEE